jgi:hypothetical protein
MRRPTVTIARTKQSAMGCEGTGDQATSGYRFCPFSILSMTVPAGLEDVISQIKQQNPAACDVTHLCPRL